MTIPPIEPKPTIVLVPGAWHSPSHYATLIGLLQEAHYPTSSSRLPSVGSKDPKSITASTDIDFIRDHLLLPLLDEGRDVVLLMHSYGGFVGAPAAKGLSKAERASEGKTGGIVGLILLAAFFGREGDALKTNAGGNLDPRIDVDVSTLSHLDASVKFTDSQEDAGQMTISDPISMFYHDVESRIAEKAVSELETHAFSTFVTPFSAPAWQDVAFDGRRAYVKATQDSAVPPFVQDLMLDNSAVEWEIRTIESAHSPFLSRPEETAEVILGLAEIFASRGEK